ncbi:hypothetical protein NUW58_g910 [Xylaria curta]|uniref:Uncharacterized protein n=1 Tax=Xylaria curta TaxID=42375 RepID=A0ACC1PQ23_9PEZI|nr:hypothetical protein NUW58_g910 [Xylaria curta]
MQATTCAGIRQDSAQPIICVWHDAPEVAPQHSLPEVYYPVPAPIAPYRGENFASIPLKPYIPYNPTAGLADVPKSAYTVTSPIQNYDNQSDRGVLPPGEQSKKTLRRVCRYPVLIIGLSAIIIILAAAVIGLAAGTGIQTHRAGDAESKLAALLSNRSNIDRGCSANPDSVTATQYTSDFYSRPTFKIFCNSDAPNPPLQSFFVGNFDDCIDACASYSAYTAGNFPRISSSGNFTCSAVSFIPSWTNRTEALAKNAPGNCYLKPGPQNPAAFTRPNGQAVHAAILQNS